MSFSTTWLLTRYSQNLKYLCPSRNLRHRYSRFCMELIKFMNGWTARDGFANVISEIANWAATQKLKDTGIEYLAYSITDVGHCGRIPIQYHFVLNAYWIPSYTSWDSRFRTCITIMLAITSIQPIILVVSLYWKPFFMLIDPFLHK